MYLQSSSESEEECNNTSNDAKDDTGNGGNHESHPGDLHVENNDHGNALDGTALDRNALDGNGGSSDIISASKRLRRLYICRLAVLGRLRRNCVKKS